MTDVCGDVCDIFDALGVSLEHHRRGSFALLRAETGGWQARSPIDGAALATLSATGAAAMDDSLRAAQAALAHWSARPAPRRGELLRRFALRLERQREPLARLVTIESGKLIAEARGEVQEMIDICDFAAGLSRQLHGLVIASERPEHKMLESWHPLGICGVITAFNFPVAVWAWNAALALVCGNALVWKPSEKTPLCAIAAHGLLAQEFAESEPGCAAVSQLWLGAREQGEYLADHPAIRLVSATGSTAMGRAVATRCAPRFKRTILELGGNNAAIVCASAPLDLATRAIVFSAVGTAGQRCTTLRRAFIHASVYDELVARLKAAYEDLRVGHPAEDGISVGPLIDGAALDAMQSALADCAARGNRISGGERLMAQLLPNACYVRPALVETDEQHETMLAETFAPILYLQRFTDLNDAIALNNAARHGLASCIFTESLREAERFLSHTGSDCGIANVNIGTSGAEIGGAFGGEKDTGGGREAGSDAWKNYMRRATNTINYGRGLPLAQGVRFGECE